MIDIANQDSSKARQYNSAKHKGQMMSHKISANKQFLRNSLSLIDYYFSTGKYPGIGHRIMKSLKAIDDNKMTRIMSREEYLRKVKPKISFIYKQINAHYFIKKAAGHPDLYMCMDVPLMDFRFAKYIREWREEMHFLVITNGLNTHLPFLLGYLVDSDIKPLLQGHTDIDALLDIICNYYETFNKKKIVPAAFQENFLFIRDYYEAVREELISIQCEIPSEEFIKEAIQIPFLDGLTPATKSHFLLLGSCTIADCVTELEEYEEMIIKEIQSQLRAKEMIDIRMETPTSFHRDQFCEVHNRYGGHNTEDCIVKQRQEKRRKKTAERHKTIEEILNKIDSIENPEEKVEVVSQFCGHPGVTKLYKTLNTLWKIPNLRKIIENKRKACTSCQRSLIRSLATSTPLKYGSNFEGSRNLGHLATSTPLKHISSDIFGPFILQSDNIKRYLITITDRCTRWTQVYPTKSITADQVIKALTDWIFTYGEPDTILHDQRSQYTSRKTKDFLKKKQIRQIQTTPYNPTGNSTLKRINQEIKFILTHDSQIRLPEAIEVIHRKLNYTYHRMIRCTPFELIYGYHPFDKNKTPIDKKHKLIEIEQRLKEQKTLCDEQNKPNIAQLQIGQEVYTIEDMNKEISCQAYGKAHFQLKRSGITR